MVGITANPDAEMLKIIIWAALAIIAVTMAIIGYFMSKRDSAITSATNNLVDAIEQLKIIVNGLQIQYQIRQPIIDEQLKIHYDRLIELGAENIRQNTAILKLETEHALFHCKYKPSIIRKTRNNNTKNENNK